MYVRERHRQLCHYLTCHYRTHDDSEYYCWEICYKMFICEGDPNINGSHDNKASDQHRTGIEDMKQSDILKGQDETSRTVRCLECIWPYRRGGN